MTDREKLIELIGSAEYGNGSLVGKNFQKGFIEKIADHLIANGFDMPAEEYKKRLAESEERVRKAEKENKMLKECLIRMTLGRYGVLDE